MKELSDVSTSADSSVEELKTAAALTSKKIKPAIKKPFLVSGSQVSPAGGTRELIMHSLMYGTNLYNELSVFRA